MVVNEASFSVLAEVTAVDDWPSEPRFETVAPRA
jgi:hypothetical protein